MKILEWIVNFLGFCLAKMPHRVFLWHVKGLGWLMQKLDNRRWKDAQTNLDFIYGDTMSQAEKQAIIKRCYCNFAFVLLESVRVSYIPFDVLNARFDFIDEHFILDALQKDGSAVLVSAHYGYWEAMATVLPPRYHWCNMASLGRLTPFDSINKMIISRRELQNVKFIDKKGAFKHLLKLYANKNALVGILVDQNISENEGVWVEFFGKKATHTTIASVISRRFEVGIVPVLIGMNDDYTHFEVRFYPPIYCQKGQDSHQDILEATQAQARVIEEAIRENPKHWFWFHKRWKSAYNSLYS